eukprot:CAMPEP_0203750554 /NCGR_PEP_ID=MMETSP0098-20131031/4765_1 /ASSEMBLY_ACC=CAM_ASM_000208 /TAXON_ID=96639 /ORGANISM=" , Strain NY0313808BC1" /LENGTH=1928 /DNA_ID=CAMNT_0050639909 /DNA_START=418 /DNA_END=6204 /DNA_ORIENTATION=+
MRVDIYCMILWSVVSIALSENALQCGLPDPLTHRVFIDTPPRSVPEAEYFASNPDLPTGNRELLGTPSSSGCAIIAYLNVFADSSCCNAYCGKVCPGDASWQNCLHQFYPDYYGAGSHLHRCWCYCKPGTYSFGHDGHGCCKTYGQECTEDEQCIIDADHDAKCQSSKLKVGVLQRLSDKTMTEEQCTAPHFWNATGKTCILSDDWKAVSAMAALAIHHFNTKRTDMIPALLDYPSCEISLKVKNFYDTESLGNTAMQSWLQMIWNDDISIVGATMEKVNKPVSVVASYFSFPQIMTGRGSRKIGDKQNYPGLFQATLDFTSVGLAYCEYFASLNYTTFVALYDENDASADDFRVELKEQCVSKGITVQSYSYSEDSFKDQGKGLETVLTEMNSTDINIFVYLGWYNGRFQQVLETATELKVIRPGTLWMFNDEEIVNAITHFHPDTKRALNGSQIIQSVGGVKGNKQFEKLLSLWPTVDSSTVNNLLPEKHHLPADFFQTYDALTSVHLRDYGTWEYDALVAMGLAACALYPSGPVTHEYWDLRYYLHQKLAQVRFDGLSGDFYMNAAQIRKESTTQVQLRNIITVEHHVGPTARPTSDPTTSPTTTKAPTSNPSVAPTLSPGTSAPTTAPTVSSPTTHTPPDFPEPTGFYGKVLATFNFTTKAFVFREGVERVFTGGSSKVPENIITRNRPPELFKVGIFHAFTDSALVSSCDADIVDGECNIFHYGSGTLLAAALLAIEHFNERLSTYAPGINGVIATECNKKITPVFHNTHSSVQGAVASLVDLLEREKVDLLVGPMPHTSITTTATLSEVYNIPQIGYTTRSPELDDFRFMRTVPSTDIMIESVCNFWQSKGYEVAAVLFPDGGYGEAHKEIITSKCMEKGITVSLFAYNPDSSEGNDDILSQLVNAKLNIVLYIDTGSSKMHAGFSDEQRFGNLMKSAFETGALRPGTMWCFVDWYVETYLSRMEYVSEQHKVLTGGSILFGSKYSQRTAFDDMYRDGLDVSTLAVKYGLNISKYGSNGLSVDKFVDSSLFQQVGTVLYDALLAAGLFACKVEPKLALDPKTFLDTLWTHQTEVTFQGLSGEVELDQFGNRVPDTVDIVVQSLVYQEGKFTKTDALSYNQGTGMFTSISGMQYNGGVQEPPTDVPHRDPTLLRVGLLQRITDASVTQEASCTAPKRWIGDKCYVSDDLKAVAVSALLAAQHYNQKDGSYASNFGELASCNKYLNLSVYDSGSSGATAIGAMEQMKKDKIDIIIGPFEDEISLASAMYGGIHKLPQISHGATSSTLNDQGNYPYFSRTVATDDTAASALCNYWSSLGYRFVAVLYEDDNYGRSYQEAVKGFCENKGITVKPFSYRLENDFSITNTTLHDLEKDTLNIVLHITKASTGTELIIKEAFAKGLVGPDKQWFFSDESIMAVLNGLDAAYASAYDGSKIVQPVGGDEDNERFASFLNDWSSFSLGKEYTELLPSEFRPGDSFFSNHDPRSSTTVAQVATYEYDAVAAAVSVACSVAPLVALDTTNFPAKMQSTLPSIQVNGLTGVMGFLSNGNRKESTSNFQMYNLHKEEDGTFRKRIIAKYNIKSQVFTFNCTTCQAVKYNGGVSVMPVDVTPPIENRNYDDAVKSTCLFFFVVNISIATVFAIWANLLRKHPVVKASQTTFLNMISLGAMISSSTILPIITDDSANPRANENGGNTKADIACNLQVWMYCLGFMLTFCPLFLKMYRVQKIFKGDLAKMVSAKISDWQLMKMCIGFVSVDIILLVLWTLIDPLKFIRDTTEFDPYGNPKNSVGTCKSEYSTVFLVAISVYHIAVLLYGSKISYQTSDLNTAFSEAKYVSVAVISALQVFILAIPLLIVIAGDPISDMFVRSGVVFLNDLSCQLVIFCPKIYFVLFGVDHDGIGGDLIKDKKKPNEKKANAKVAPKSK